MSAMEEIETAEREILKGSVESGVKRLQRALVANPLSFSVSSSLFQAFTLLGQTDKAEKTLKLCLLLSPHHPTTLYNSAVIAYKKGCIEEATDHLKLAVGFCGKKPEYEDCLVACYFALATLKNQLGLVDEAMAWWRRCVSQDSLHQSANFHLGNVLLKQGRFKEGLTCLRKVEDSEMMDGEGLLSMGIAEEQIGQHEEAIVHYQKAIKSGVESSSCFFHLACTNAISGKHAEAILHFRKCIVLNQGDDNLEALNLLALSLQHENQL